MTKVVRIENADASNYRVVVELYEKKSDGTDTLIWTENLSYPTAMTSPAVILTSDRYIVVREEPPTVW